jgi:hypothetical protein
MLEMLEMLESQRNPDKISKKRKVDKTETDYTQFNTATWQ